MVHCGEAEWVGVKHIFFSFLGTEEMTMFPNGKAGLEQEVLRGIGVVGETNLNLNSIPTLLCDVIEHNTTYVFERTYLLHIHTDLLVFAAMGAQEFRL